MSATEFVHMLRVLGQFYDAIFQLEYSAEHDLWTVRLWTHRPDRWATHALRLT
jgi:hypothetical protein